ncbi:MAG: molybdopterin-dependent oxidoreductase [Nitrososphaerales archaeon]
MSSFQICKNYLKLNSQKTFDRVTKWSIKDVVWDAIAFREIATLTGIKPEAKWVMFHCADGYTAHVPREDAMVEDSLIAFQMNGRPIPQQQGFPARPFIPYLYGWKSAKWLTEIEFLSEYRDGYWEMYGYHERGDVWDEERFKGHEGKHSPQAEPDIPSHNPQGRRRKVSSPSRKGSMQSVTSSKNETGMSHQSFTMRFGTRLKCSMLDVRSGSL